MAAVRIRSIMTNVEIADGAVECRIRKMAGNWAGIVFRQGPAGGLEVMLDAEGRLMLRRQPANEVVALAALPQTKAPYRTLRVVGLGPVIRVYVDGAQRARIRDETLFSGRAGLLVHIAHVFYDDFVITRQLRDEEAVLLTAAAPGGALLAAPGQPAQIEIVVSNALLAPRQAALTWAQIGPDGAPGPWSEEPLTLTPGQNTSVILKPGALTPGLARFALAIKDGAKELTRLNAPVACVARPDGKPDDPFFPIGAYDKYRLGGEPWERNTYLHAMCADLRAHGVNTILTGGVMNPATKEQFDTVASYGMKVVLRMDRPAPPVVVNHPAVLALLLGDEPKAKDLPAYKKRYEELAAQHPDKLVGTCMVGEAVCTGEDNDPWRIWPELKPRLCMARYYPMRKAAYNLVDSLTYKGWLPPSAVFALFEKGAGDRAWWYVAQTFGGRVEAGKPEPYWRNPTGVELTGMLHMALAHGAKGVFCYTYQRENPQWMALVDQESLKPLDDKYDGLAAWARTIAPARPVLLNSVRSGMEIRVRPWTVEAVGRKTPDGRLFAYLANRDTSNPAQCDVFIPFTKQNKDTLAVVEAKDLFSGVAVNMRKNDNGSAARVSLAPGGGQLWELKLAPAAQ